jgi:predicted ABC-type ATPase
MTCQQEVERPELYIKRVRLRVSRGGHDIPDVDIRREYSRSLMRAPEALGLADEVVVLDNSGLHPVLAEWAAQLARFQGPGN